MQRPDGDPMSALRQAPALAGVSAPAAAPRTLALVDSYRVAGIAIALILWQLASFQLGNRVLPTPLNVVAFVGENLVSSPYLRIHGLPGGEGGWLPQVLYSVQNVVIGVATGTIIGTTFGLLSVRVPVIAEIVAPITATLGAAPIVIAAPFFLIWFGIVPAAQIIMVGFYTTLLMFVYSRRAAHNVRPDYVESSLTLGSGPWTTFLHVYLPASVPEVIAGLRIALAGSWGLEAIAELLGAQGGAGFLMKFYAGVFIIEGMLGLTLLLGSIAIAFDFFVVRAARFIARWSEAGHQLQL